MNFLKGYNHGNTQNYCVVSTSMLLALPLAILAEERAEPAVLPSGNFGVVQNTYDAESRVYSTNGIWSATPQSETRNGEGDCTPYRLSVSYNKIEKYTVANCIGIPTVSTAGYTSVVNPGSPDNFSIYSPEGDRITSRPATAQTMLGFSSAGYHYGITSNGSTDIIECKSGKIRTYPTSVSLFTVAGKNEVTALAIDNNDTMSIQVFDGEKRVHNFIMETPYVRAIELSSDGKFLAAVEISKLTLFDLTSGKIVTEDHLPAGDAFMDLAFGTETLWAGVRRQNEEHTEFWGFMRTYSFDGKCTSFQEKSYRSEPIQPLSRTYADNEIPWPFAPQDQIQHVWNGYLVPVRKISISNIAYS